MSKLGKFAAACAAVLCGFGAWAAERSVSQVTTYDDVTPKSAVVTVGAGTEGETNVLAVCWGDKDYGATFADWPKYEYLAKLDAAATVYDYTYPAAIADNWKGSVKAVRFFVLEGDLTPPPSDAYVGDDALWMQLDGIDNAGLGLHSNTTNRWTDLCGHVDWSWAACCAWADDAMVFTPSGSVRMTPAYRNGAKYADFGNVRTMEVVYKPNVLDGVVFTPGCNNAYWLEFSQGKACVYYRTGVSVAAGVATSLAGTYNSLVSNVTIDGEVYKNGELVTPSKLTDHWNAYTAVGLGNRGDGGSYNGNSRANGTLYALRLYTRKLTAEEIAQNYAIDAARYGLGGIYIADPVSVGSDVFLPEKLALTVDYSASPEGRGTVTASAETFREDDVVTFTAEAAANCSFVRWEGSLVPDGQATQNPLVLTLKESGTVTAVFGAKYLVSTDGDDDKNDGLTAPFATVEKAMSVVHANDTISLAAGKYPLSAEVALDKSIKILGAGKEETMIVSSGAADHRAFNITDAGAILQDLAVVGFTNSVNKQGAAVYLSQGTIENCRIAWSSVTIREPQGVALRMDGGLVRNCLFDHNTVAKSAGTRCGDSVYMTAGLLENCVIRDNIPAVENSQSSLHITGGTARGVQVINNKILLGGGAAVYMTGGLFEKGVIRECGHCALRLSGKAVAQNSLIVGNANDTSTTAGVDLAGGKLYNCTLVGNVAGKDATGCSALSMSSGTAVNNVFWNNGNGRGEVVKGGTFNTNLVDAAVTVGVGNQAVDPQFADAANGDYRVVFGSAAIDAGAALAEVTEDYAGSVRPQGAAPDLGAYEFADDGSFKVGVRISDANVPEGGTVTATAVVSGEATAYAWYLNGALVADETGSSVTFENLPAGKATVKVVVTDGQGATHEKTLMDAFDVHPLKTYANAANADGAAYPYNTPDTAATTIADALAAVWQAANVTTEVEVAAGAYPIEKAISLAMPVKVTGAGRDVTTVSQMTAGDRAFNLNSKGCSLAGVRITGFKNTLNGGAIQMSAGLVADCTIEKSSKSSGSGLVGGGVTMSGGKLLRCLIKDNSLKGVSQSRSGGGVYMSGGEVEDCDLEGNQTNTSNSGDKGEAIYMDGGTVRNCRVSGSVGAQSQIVSAAIYMVGATSAPLVENCVITNNQPLGVRVSSGTIRNSVIANNSGTSTIAAGAYIDGGTMVHCTVYGNVAEKDATGCSGLEMTKGTAINNIFWKNGGTLGACRVTGGTFNTNIVDNIVSVGTYNRADDPMLTGAATNDYRLVFGSPAIDEGAPFDGVDADIVGTERPLGKGPDLGAYEYVPGADFSVGLQVSPAECGEGDPVTLTAVVSGEAASYAWYVDGAFAGDTETLTLTTLGSGRHSFRLVVTDAAGKEYSDEKSEALNVRPVKTYAATDGGNVWPYDEPGKAATNLEDAVDAVWQSATATTIVEVAAGTYATEAEIALGAPVRVLGAGREVTRIVQAKTGHRCFNVNSDGAEVAGFTVSGFKCDDHGRGIKMSKGLVRDCIVENSGDAGYPYDSYGCGIYLSGGTVSNCIVRGCRFSGGGGRTGAGIYMSDGLVAGCEICNNSTGQANNNDRGEGVWMDGGTLRNCQIHDNFGRSDSLNSAAVVVAGKGALVENCEIYGNRPYGLRLGDVASTVRNCLIHSNSNAVGIATGVSMGGGTLYNCTIAGNLDSSDGLPPGLRMSKGVAVNNIVWGNGTNCLATGSATVTGGTFNTNLVDVAVATGVGNLVGDPKFRNSVRGNYRIRSGSLAQNAGVNQDWMDGATDIQGNLRILNKVVDIGCYEVPVTGMTLIVR